MRYHKASLAALATQPSHQFDREGVLVLKERHDSFFRKSEVSSERWCRLRGNLLCYLKTRDHWSEPAGLLVLENCSVVLESAPNNTFTIEFGTGLQQSCEACSTEDRDGWVVAIRAGALAFLADRVESLQKDVTAKKSVVESLAPARPLQAVPPLTSPRLELSLSCDNLRCDATGLPPACCVAVQLLPHSYAMWQTCHITEAIQGSSNPVFVSSVVLGGGPTVLSAGAAPSAGGCLDDGCRVRLVARRVLEPLSHTTTVIGMAVTTVGSLRQSPRQRLSLLSLSGESVGFVSVCSWASEEDTLASGDQPPPYAHYTPTHSQTSLPPHHRRTQSLPPRLSCKSRLPTPPPLCPVHTRPVTATYRFHSGLGGDIAVVEIMAESRLTFTLPQQLLSIWLGAERAWQEELQALGLLSEPWASTQRALINMHASRITQYESTSAALALQSREDLTLKRSVDKELPLLELAPTNLALQRVWAQNESLRRAGAYDVHTVGAFAANAQGCGHGGLLTQLQENNRRCRAADGGGRANSSRDGIEATRRLRAAVAVTLNALLADVAAGRRAAAMAGLKEVRKKIDLFLSALEPDVVEAAFDFLDQIKVPQSPSHVLTLASRNYSVHSDLSGYLSPETSLDRTLGMHACTARDEGAAGKREGEQCWMLRQVDTGVNKVIDVRIQQHHDGVSSPVEGVEQQASFGNTGTDAKYYCSTDEPEPWDLIKLNLQASFICLSAKVNAILNDGSQASCMSPSDEILAPLAHIDGLSQTSATSCDLLLTQHTTSPEMSPTEDDSGIGMDRTTPEAERRQPSGGLTAVGVPIVVTSSVKAGDAAVGVREELLNCCIGAENGSDAASARPKLASIMETSREDTLEGDDRSGECVAVSSRSLLLSERRGSNCISSDSLQVISSTNRFSIEQGSKHLVNNTVSSVVSSSVSQSIKDTSAISYTHSSRKREEVKKSKLMAANGGDCVQEPTASSNNACEGDRRSSLPILSNQLSNSSSICKPLANDFESNTLEVKIRKSGEEERIPESRISPSCRLESNLTPVELTQDPIVPSMVVANNSVPFNANKQTETSKSTNLTLHCNNNTRHLDFHKSSDKQTELLKGRRPPTTVSSDAPVAAASHRSEGGTIASVVPSVVKLRGAVDGAVRTARLVHSLHRLQLPTEFIQRIHNLQYRRDVCFSQALTSAVTALLTRLWSRSADHNFLTVLQQLGPLLQFEGLLSCYGGDGARLSDMVVAVEDLATVEFVLIRAETGAGGEQQPYIPQPVVTGNRCGLRVLLPVPGCAMRLVPHDPSSGPLTFHVTPVLFNVGINEEATLAGKLGLEGPQHRNNLDSFHRLAEYHHRYAKLTLPEESSKRVATGCGGGGSLAEVMERLWGAVRANKNKNTEVLHLAAAATRAMAGLRFTSCKSGKDRTAMSVTLEQTRLLTSEFDLARTEQKRALQAMRSEGTRLVNCQKNIGLKKFAFNTIQLSMFPRDYVPPHGTYGATKT